MNNIPMQMQVPADLVQIQKNYLAEWKPAPRPWHSNATLQAEITKTLNDASLELVENEQRPKTLSREKMRHKQNGNLTNKSTSRTKQGGSKLREPRIFILKT